jgi:alginate O-acetyltransferase complex protein AlgJ
MLHGYRRHLALLAFGLLATPLVVGIVKPDSPESILKEGRTLAPAPNAPVSRGDWLKLPEEIDAYLRDHFGFRQVLIRTHKDVTRPLLGFGNDTVLIGRDGRMFYLGEETVRQSAGLLVRDQRVACATDMLVHMNQELQARSIRFLVAPPPNGATIYQDDLPHWAQNPGKPTEYDLLLANLAAKGVPAVDLRPAVKKARNQGPVFYMHDTHWTFRGALAAYNAIAEADSHPEWRIEPGFALGPMNLRKGGDLARMFGVGDAVSEFAEELTLPQGKKVLQSSDPFGDFTETSEKAGPTILILGDSFTGGYLPAMILQHAHRVIWMDHKSCGFDWSEVETYHPDEVWWMPNERFLVCKAGLKPMGLPEGKLDSAEGRAPGGLAEQIDAAGKRHGAQQ